MIRTIAGRKGLLSDRGKGESLVISRTSSKPTPGTLRDALDDLNNIVRYAADAGCPAPDRTTVTVARSLLLWMHEQAPRYYGAGPDTGGGIAIDAQDPQGCTISVIVEPGGSIVVVKFPNDGQALRRYASLSGEAYNAIGEQLHKLEPHTE